MVKAAGGRQRDVVHLHSNPTRRLRGLANVLTMLAPRTQVA